MQHLSKKKTFGIKVSSQLKDYANEILARVMEERNYPKDEAFKHVPSRAHLRRYKIPLIK